MKTRIKLNTLLSLQIILVFLSFSFMAHAEEKKPKPGADKMAICSGLLGKAANDFAGDKKEQLLHYSALLGAIAITKGNLDNYSELNRNGVDYYNSIGKGNIGDDPLFKDCARLAATINTEFNKNIR